MNPLLTLAIGAVALLYAPVGHAGATGYIAVMTLFGLDPQVIRPTVIGAVVVGAAGGLVGCARFPTPAQWHGQPLA